MHPGGGIDVGVYSRCMFWGILFIYTWFVFSIVSILSTKRETVIIVGSVKVNFLSYRYRADKSTIFGMRGLWGLTINSGRGATLKHL